MGKNRIKPKPQLQDPLPEPELLREFEGKKQEKQEEAEKKNEADPEALQRKELRRKRREKLRSALDGSVVLDKGLPRYWMLVLYAFFLAMLLITNNYISEAVVRESSSIKGELKELHFRQISSKAELMRISRQSSVAELLFHTGVKESVVPPFKIKDASARSEDNNRRSDNRRRMENVREKGKKKKE